MKYMSVQQCLVCLLVCLPCLVSRSLPGVILWSCIVKPGSYFLLMRSECCVTKFVMFFAAVQLRLTHLRISLRKDSCDIKFTSNSLRICIRRKYEPGFTMLRYYDFNKCSVKLWRKSQLVYFAPFVFFVRV